MEKGWREAKQSFAVHQDYRYNPETGRRELIAACAIGAACHAVAPDRELRSWDEIAAVFPQLKEWLEPAQLGDELRQTIKAPGAPSITLRAALILMNDRLLMPKEQIIATLRGWGY
jgi:hypothetical protein